MAKTRCSECGCSCSDDNVSCENCQKVANELRSKDEAKLKAAMALIADMYEHFLEGRNAHRETEQQIGEKLAMLDGGCAEELLQRARELIDGTPQKTPLPDPVQ
jgi:hypothetical protein